MNEDQTRRARIRLSGDERVFEVTRPNTRPLGWQTDVGIARRRAQGEADAAYEVWNRERSADAYTAFRAAQDRADAAQDELARSHASLT